ncbi:hypothetical protein A1O7_08783 [Cladophialophora yegresii CBS 114405]|uniref:Uncharacterized protein n=1 Tax=Cladophialophora yegresii CBS 114405 TaxID=1182544 RepID=W9VJM0_9EURO|nr:uncharacterized protein A1O7_08783 [Cladophialophora yegresii CBS 114405]EXJ55852.1 hypothetical protein A1O7_08783 [Cladophialophora yegresii CBS 114405]
MASDPRVPPSNYPPSMGPGARPTNPSGDSPDTRTKLMQIMQVRSKYQVSVEPETLSLSYELNDSPRLYRLPFDALPLQGFSRWWLFGGPQRARQAGVLAIDIIRGSENVAKRPVTQQEAEALTYWTSKRLLYSSYATAASIVLGTFLARRGHARMKFPILPAKPLEQYNHFPLKQAPILTGQLAQSAWQFTRYSVWIQLTFLVASPTIGTAASVYIANAMSKDSRTQELVHALDPKRGWEGGGRSDSDRNMSPEQQQHLPSGFETPNQGQDFEADFQRSSRDLDRDGRADQAMAHDYNTGDSIERGAANGMGTLSDSAVKDRESRRQYERYPSSPQQQSQTYGQSTIPSASGDSDPFFYDDASPTAGNDPDNASPVARTQPSGGSVWERLRRGGNASPSPSRPPAYDARVQPGAGRPSRTTEQEADFSDRDAYSSSETKFGSAGSFRDGRDRERAQREFDEMLERERQQSGSGDYDRGMRAVEQGEESGNAATGASGGGGGGGGSAWERRRRE